MAFLLATTLFTYMYLHPYIPKLSFYPQSLSKNVQTSTYASLGLTQSKWGDPSRKFPSLKWRLGTPVKKGEKYQKPVFWANDRKAPSFFLLLFCIYGRVKNDMKLWGSARSFVRWPVLPPPRGLSTLMLHKYFFFLVFFSFSYIFARCRWRFQSVLREVEMCNKQW